MIPRLFTAGKSFKGVARYLTHDPDKAKTAERVAWTETLNLAHDDIPSAVNEMLWTYRAADMLKRQAGLAAGGRRLDSPAKHFSLNWHPSEHPTREHMTETVQDFLKHMGWHEHQAVLVCHNDRHPHVHVLLNAVHPETGRALDTGFEKRRAQEWALKYERDHDLIFCEERLKPKEERTASPTRETWEKLRQGERQFDQAEAERMARAPEYFERGDRTAWQAKEWDALKGYQREQREAFFAGGKQAYREVRNAVYREVRTEFRAEWRAFYQEQRAGADSDRLAETKADILARQNAELENRRDAACAELRDDRDADYKNLKLAHRMQREMLTDRQEQGLHSPQLLEIIYGRGWPLHNENGRDSAHSERRTDPSFREAADEVCEPRPEAQERDDQLEPEIEGHAAKENHRLREPAGAAGDLGMAAIGVIAEVGERLFDGFFGGGQKSSARAVPPSSQKKQQPRNDNAPRAAELQMKAAEAQATEAEQLHAYWKERGRRRGRDRD